MERCVLLNADYTFLNVIGWKRAFKMIINDKVQVLEYSDQTVKCGSYTFQMPAIVKLIKLIRTIYRNRVPFTKKNVMVRDGFECVYCGDRYNLTIDHIVPTSRGGKTSFENCVTSCRECNNTKGSRTPNEAHMFMKKKPYQPTISEFLMIKMKQMGIDKILDEFLKGVF
jgi:5-methylcytosine-specific restriction endonuclease McrA